MNAGRIALEHAHGQGEESIQRPARRKMLEPRRVPTGDRTPSDAQQCIHQENDHKADNQKRQGMGRVIGQDAVIDLQNNDGKPQPQDVQGEGSKPGGRAMRRIIGCIESATRPRGHRTDRCGAAEVLSFRHRVSAPLPGANPNSPRTAVISKPN